jgi:hypothetical protein
MADEMVTKADKPKTRQRAQNPSVQERELLAQSVKASLHKAQERAIGFRKMATFLFVTSVVAPAAATLVAALTALIGGNNIFPQAAAQVDDGGWKLACALVAILAFIATVSSMFKKQADEQLSQGNRCAGRLTALDAAVAISSHSWEEMTREYEDIVKAYPDLVS